MRDLLCAGISVADCVARPVAGTPPRGKLVVIDSLQLHNGGCALNTGIASARLGLKSGVASVVGTDPLGDFLLGRMRDEGVDSSGVVRTDRRQTSATSVLISRDGERSFLHVVGASAVITDRTVPDRLVRRYRMLHIGGFFLMPGFDGAPARRLLKRAKKLGRLTSLDTAWGPGGRWPILKPCLKHVDYYMPSIEEAEAVFGRSRGPAALAAAALDAGVRRAAILKMGRRGCFALERGGKALKVPAFRIRAIDTVGAGDAFNAGFLYGVLRGWPTLKSLKLGNATGALCVSGPGATGKIRGLAQARRLAGV